MSLGTLLQKIGQFIHNLFANTVKELDTVILPAAIAVTNALKTIVDTDTTDVIGALAGAAGAKLEDKVRSTLAKIVPKLQLAQQFLSGTQDVGTILADVIKVVGSSNAI